jgi:predicted transcriptional regulator
MEKISSKKVAAVLSTVPNMLRGLAKERDDLLEKNARLQSQVHEYQRREHIERIVKTAEKKGIDSWGETHEEKIASIEAAVERGRSLDVMEEAVKLSAAGGNLASLTGDELTGSDGASEVAKSQLESYLLGNLG